MELVDEFATQITEMNYGQETYIDVVDGIALDNGMRFSNDAQEYYNEMYSEYESLLNRLGNIYPEKS
jgi:hypothetical protein